nr:ATP-binding cassette domain-containing protein [Micromonospora sp. DSM 115978]
VAGEAVGGMAAHEVAARGVSHVPEGRRVFGRMTVYENLQMGAYRDRSHLRDDLATVYELFPRLAERAGQLAGTLSGGEQQMLALAKALLLRPRLLLVDELSLGLAPSVVGELIEVVAGLRGTGTTMVLVEQSVNVACAVADRAVFMEKGRVRFSGPPAELLERGDLLRAVFLGTGEAQS